MLLHDDAMAAFQSGEFVVNGTSAIAVGYVEQSSESREFDLCFMLVNTISSDGPCILVMCMTKEGQPIDACELHPQEARWINSTMERLDLTDLHHTRLLLQHVQWSEAHAKAMLPHIDGWITYFYRLSIAESTD